jgi:gamma-glutamylputrescine oxidase
MNPLFRNDKRGEYPPSWYAATANPPPARAPLQGSKTADVAILGAGYTGLWAAKTLAAAGLKVIVLEAHRAGWGASGRNGGQVGSGYNWSVRDLEAGLGQQGAPARDAWLLAEEAKSQLRDFCATAPETAYQPGVAHGAYSASEVAKLRADADHLARNYGYDQIDSFGQDDFLGLVKSPRYVGGILDRGAGHIHPLNYALALARAAETAGAVIHEGSEVHAIDHGARVTLRTGQGQVTANHAIIAGNGYLPNIERKIASRVMPINSFIAATEPLPDRWQDVLAQDIAVADSKFVVNYYRFSSDRRFLFGGRESYTLGFPTDIKGPLVKRMESLFPQLMGVRIDHVWGGTLGITMSRLPHIARIAPNVMSGAGFSGHGVALSGIAGRAMAEAILGQTFRFDVLSKLPVPAFPGGAAFRAPLLTLAMTWYALRDRLGF